MKYWDSFIGNKPSVEPMNIWHRTEATYSVCICDNILCMGTINVEYHCHFYPPIHRLIFRIPSQVRYELQKTLDLLNSGTYSGIDPVQFCEQLLGTSDA